MNYPHLCKTWEHHWSRRRWLGAVTGAAAGGLGFRDLLQPAMGEALLKRDRQVLFIWCDGGMSQLESWDPKPNTRFGGPFRSIPTSLPGIHFSELVPRTARLLQHLVVIRNLHTQDNSHTAGVGRIQRGDPQNRGVTYPYFGSAVTKLLGSGTSGLPPYVWVKPGSGGFIHQDSGFLPPQYGALAFGDGKPPENLLRPDEISSEEDELRNRLREAANRRYGQRRRPQNREAYAYVYDSARTLMRRQDLFDDTQFSSKDIERYGRHDFGQHMLLGRKMLEAGIRFVKISSLGWDTHGDHFNGQLSLMSRFDQAFSAMIEDLHDRGMLDHVLVIAMSEFGRTPRINGHIGRDHCPETWSLVMAGAGLQRGVVIGKTNDLGTFIEGDEYDIGHMFHTWFKALGVDPDATEYDNNGQPLPIAHPDCYPVAEALA